MSVLLFQELIDVSENSFHVREHSLDLLVDREGLLHLTDPLRLFLAERVGNALEIGTDVGPDTSVLVLRGLYGGDGHHRYSAGGVERETELAHASAAALSWGLVSLHQQPLQAFRGFSHEVRALRSLGIRPAQEDLLLPVCGICVEDLFGEVDALSGTFGAVDKALAKS